MTSPLVLLSSQGAQVPSMGWLVVKTLILLVVLGGLMYIVFRFGGSWMRLPLLRKAPSGDLVLRSTLPLEPGRALHLVSLGDREYLIGSSDKGLVLLSERQRLEAAATVEPEVQEAPPL